MGEARMGGQRREIPVKALTWTGAVLAALLTCAGATAEDDGHLRDFGYHGWMEKITADGERGPAYRLVKQEAAPRGDKAHALLLMCKRDFVTLALVLTEDEDFEGHLEVDTFVNDSRVNWLWHPLPTGPFMLAAMDEIESLAGKETLFLEFYSSDADYRIEFDLEGIDDAVEKFSSECERIGPDD